MRGAFWLASAAGFLSLTVFGFCLSFAPGDFSHIVHADSRPMIGLLAGLTLGSSALSQLLAVTPRSSAPSTSSRTSAAPSLSSGWD